MRYVCGKIAFLCISLLSVVGFARTPAVLNFVPTYDFGSVTQGAKVDYTLTVTNSGQSRADFNSITAPSAPFSFKGGAYPGFKGNCGKALGAGHSCRIVFTFSPAAIGAVSSSMRISYFDSASVQSASIALSGTGVGPAVLTFNGMTLLDFGNVAAGTSKQLPVTIRNTGGSTATYISVDSRKWSSNFTVTGTWPGPGGTCSTSLAAGSTCTFIVTASPTRTRTYTQTATLSYYDPLGLRQITLAMQVKGTGTSPEITSISPATGPTAGGTNVTINGNNFTNPVSVAFRGIAATNVVRVSTTRVTCTAPAAAAGTANVVVTDPGGTATLIDGFLYSMPPRIDSVSPGSGLSQIVNSLTIVGAGFATGATVTVAGSVCTGITVVSEATITCSSPALPAQVANVVVTNPDGQSATLSNAFQYQSYFTWVDGSALANQNTAGKPSGRENGTTWSDSAGNLWLFGGYGAGTTATGAAANGRLGDLWKYSAGAWTRVTGSAVVNQRGVYGTMGVPAANTTPGARFSGTGWVDVSNRLWLYGGFGYDANGSLGSLADLWMFDGAQWTWMAGSNLRNQRTNTAPGGRYAAVSWKDGAGNFWLFGGMGYDNSGVLGENNDLWVYNGAWTRVSGSTSANALGSYGSQGLADPINYPSARNAASAWADTSGNFWLFGGTAIDSTGAEGYINDLWKFDGTNWTWVNGSNTMAQVTNYGTKGVASASNIPGARYSGVPLTDSDGHIWLFSGYGLDDAGLEGTLSDLWMFDGANWTWKDGNSGVDDLGFYGTVGVAAVTNLIGGRQTSMGWIDPLGKFWFFGGTGFDSNGVYGQLSDLWNYVR